jgi:hypothetical protein
MEGNSDDYPSNDKSRPFPILVVEDLHYCCEWAFHVRNKDTGLIAARLGCCQRTAQRRKALFDQGLLACAQAKKCFGNLL